MKIEFALYEPYTGLRANALSKSKFKFEMHGTYARIMGPLCRTLLTRNYMLDLNRALAAASCRIVRCSSDIFKATLPLSLAFPMVLQNFKVDSTWPFLKSLLVQHKLSNTHLRRTDRRPHRSNEDLYRMLLSCAFSIETVEMDCSCYS